jgi:beta-glucosidase
MTAGQTYKIRLEYFEGLGDAGMILGWKKSDIDLEKGALDAAKNSDVVLLFIGTTERHESEGNDRVDLYLPGDQDDLVMKILDVNPNVVVVLQNGAPVMMNKWIGNVKGIVEAWFPGVEGGNAIADILTGAYNPSGKLPVTFPVKWEDCSAYKYYKMEEGTTRYDDGIYVGYRHFDKKGIEPLFPFGFGLSYTNFEYSDLKVISKGKENYEVTFTVKNTGKVSGTEVAQLYCSENNPKIDRPVQELKGFKRVELNPGDLSNVKLNLNHKDLSFFDEASHSWKVEPGQYRISIGASSRDIKLKTEIVVK